MKKFFHNWKVLFALSLIVLSLMAYCTHYLIFNDAHHILIFLVADIAFVPLEVLLVTLLIHRVLEAREKRENLKKMNMVIGTFFHEVGLSMIKEVIKLDNNRDKLAEVMTFTTDWTDKDFIKANIALEKFTPAFNLNHDTIETFKSYLVQKRKFLLSLLENSNLLEHDYFTDLLWAIFHLIEELLSRGTIENYTEEDLSHLKIDLERAYSRLLKEWAYYIRHLKEEYPYLYVFMARNNPCHTSK